ncbi:hypothetical protein NC652_019867 [Populus alba x Populus x berolinensis]|nr:hypothetical protein NC652_019867 [Populus alba x Populus x berolinensis]
MGVISCYLPLLSLRHCICRSLEPINVLLCLILTQLYFINHSKTSSIEYGVRFSFVF